MVFEVNQKMTGLSHIFKSLQRSWTLAEKKTLSPHCLNRELYQDYSVISDPPFLQQTWTGNRE